MHVRPGSVLFDISLRLLLPIHPRQHRPHAIKAFNSASGVVADEEITATVVASFAVGEGLPYVVSVWKHPSWRERWDTYHTASGRRWRRQWPTAMIVAAICSVVSQDSVPQAHRTETSHRSGDTYDGEQKRQSPW